MVLRRRATQRTGPAAGLATEPVMTAGSKARAFRGAPLNAVSG